MSEQTKEGCFVFYPCFSIVVDAEVGMASLSQIESPKVSGEMGYASPIRRMYHQGENFIFFHFFADNSLQRPSSTGHIYQHDLPSAWFGYCHAPCSLGRQGVWIVVLTLLCPCGIIF